MTRKILVTRYLLQMTLYNLGDKCNKANRLAIAYTIHQNDDGSNSLLRFPSNIDRATKEQSIIELYQMRSIFRH